MEYVWQHSRSSPAANLRFPVPCVWGSIFQPVGGLPPVASGGVSSVALTDGNVVIEFSGTLKSAASVTGPYSAVDGATSPYSVAPSKAAEFYIAE